TLKKTEAIAASEEVECSCKRQRSSSVSRRSRSFLTFECRDSPCRRGGFGDTGTTRIHFEASLRTSIPGLASASDHLW
ncbi:hypothetical protein PFISCL1PPCAC_12482, partial [Pristionchus fissidentatus]